MSEPKKHKSDAVLVLCICPRCGRRHKVSIFYTGRINPPRIYCRWCRATVGTLEDTEVIRVHLGCNRLNDLP